MTVGVRGTRQSAGEGAKRSLAVDSGIAGRNCRGWAAAAPRAAACCIAPETAARAARQRREVHSNGVNGVQSGPNSGPSWFGPGSVVRSSRLLALPVMHTTVRAMPGR
jgi:hypothetical protein